MLGASPEVLALASAPLFVELRERYRDREWRLDNIYYIRNDEGERIKFKRNDAQIAFYREMALRNVLPKARKLGFSTLIAILICDQCVFRKGNLAGIIDRTLDDAVDKLAIIRYAYQNLHPEIRAANPLVKDNQEYLEWRNGSSVSVGTSYRGGTPADLHVSEYGKISVDSPESAREIKTGAIQAVPATGRIWVESTAHGTSGEFAEMVKRAEARALAKSPMTPLDMKFHFFGWWAKREYRLPNNLVTVSAELKKYFGEVEAKIGRRLDADQRAWYAKKLEELGPDDIKEEFPSTADELFYVSQQGTYWREEISRARREGRIGLPVSYDPSRLVNTAWDIGQNMTAIWFYQTDGVRYRFIDYWEEEGGSLPRSCRLIHEKKAERGFVYGKHLGPHDIENGDWSVEGKTRKALAEAMGVKFTTVPRIRVKEDSIEQGRRLLNVSYFDSEHAGHGVARLENYRKRWNKQMGQFTSDPLEDGNEHGADAYQGAAMGDKPEKPPRDAKAKRDRPKRSAFSA